MDWFAIVDIKLHYLGYIMFKSMSEKESESSSSSNSNQNLSTMTPWRRYYEREQTFANILRRSGAIAGVAFPPCFILYQLSFLPLAIVTVPAGFVLINNCAPGVLPAVAVTTTAASVFTGVVGNVAGSAIGNSADAVLGAVKATFNVAVYKHLTAEQDVQVKKAITFLLDNMLYIEDDAYLGFFKEYIKRYQAAPSIRPSRSSTKLLEDIKTKGNYQQKMGQVLEFLHIEKNYAKNSHTLLCLLLIDYFGNNQFKISEEKKTINCEPLPEDVCCGISLALAEDPVIIPKSCNGDGQLYDRNNLIKQVKTTGSDKLRGYHGLEMTIDLELLQNPKLEILAKIKMYREKFDMDSDIQISEGVVKKVTRKIKM